MNNLTNIKTGLDASYKDNKTAGSMLSKQGFSLDDQLSGKRAKVFIDGEGKPVVSFRGTSNKKDMVTDALIMAGLGKYTNRVKHSKKVIKEVEAKYKQPSAAIGHSLGAHLAQTSGAKGKIVTYNGLQVNNNNKNQTNIRTNKDLASIFTKKNRNNVTLNSKSNNPFVAHSTKSLKDKNVIKGRFV